MYACVLTHMCAVRVCVPIHICVTSGWYVCVCVCALVHVCVLMIMCAVSVCVPIHIYVVSNSYMCVCARTHSCTCVS